MGPAFVLSIGVNLGRYSLRPFVEEGPLGSDEPDHLRDVLGDHLHFGPLYLDVAAGHDVGEHDALAHGAEQA